MCDVRVIISVGSLLLEKLSRGYCVVVCTTEFVLCMMFAVAKIDLCWN